MSSKAKSKEKEENQKDSSSDENNEPPYKSKAHQMFLDIEEKPEVIIEKILINLFNKNINPDNVYNEDLEIQMQQNKVKILCTQQEKSKIVYILLSKIRSLINKYKEKLFELPNIIELREKIFQNYYKRSHSSNKIISKKYLSFFIEKRNFSHSFPKIKKFDYYLVVKNLICELKNIRNCLKITAPLIEKIFEIALSKYEKFSIWECEREDYLTILIHDKFIWNQINRSRHSSLRDIISEITEDDNINLNSMTYRINYFKHIEENKKNNLDDILKIMETGLSADTRFPEDARPIEFSKEELHESVISVDRDMRNSCEEVDIDEFTNSGEQNIDEGNGVKKITNFKTSNRIITKSGVISKSILTSKTINNINININKENTFIGIPRILKNNDIRTNEDFEKITSLNRIIEIKSANNINKKKKKELKKKNLNKKENNSNKKSVKIDKSEIPNDLDDLVKYIVNDDKVEAQIKKKKKNKKRKKKNKNEIKEEKQEEKETHIKENEKKDEIEDIKEDLLQNSINRYKIHKIKFKYRPKWLNKISKNS